LFAHSFVFISNFFKAIYVICVQKKSQGIQALDVRKSTTDEETIIESAAIYKPAFATSFLSETIVLGERNLINVFRTKELFFIRLCITVHNSSPLCVCVCVSLSLSRVNIEHRSGQVVL
jgi:hypothetical protein